MEIDLESTIEKIEKAVKALEYLGVVGLAVLTYLVAHWRAHRASRPRAQIAELKSESAALRKLIGEIASSVSANSENIIGVTDQLQGIVGDAERKIARQEGRFVSVGVHEDLCDRVQALDDRIWELGGGAPRRRASGGVRREVRHDTSDR